MEDDVVQSLGEVYRVAEEGAFGDEENSGHEIAGLDDHRLRLEILFLPHLFIIN